MKLLVVTGPDGAGKSTLCAEVARRLDARDGPGTAHVAQVWDSLAGLLSREQAQRYLGAISHRSRATLLAHALARALDLGTERSARVLLFDGYWYKYAVSEAEHGAPAALFEASGFPRPHLVVALDLPVDDALARKRGALTAYEQGFAEGDFRAFQERLRARWDALEARVGPWVHLDGHRAPDDLAEDVIARLGALTAA